MTERIKTRIAELEAELQAGGTRMRELESERTSLHETLLRIDGARLALGELLEDTPTERPVVREAVAS